MGLHDRDYMRDPAPLQHGGGRRRGFSLDGGLLLGIALVAIGLSALIIKGFKEQRERDDMLAELASFDPHYNGGFPRYLDHIADIEAAMDEHFVFTTS